MAYTMDKLRLIQDVDICMMFVCKSYQDKEDKESYSDNYLTPKKLYCSEECDAKKHSNLKLFELAHNYPRILFIFRNRRIQVEVVFSPKTFNRFLSFYNEIILFNLRHLKTQWL